MIAICRLCGRVRNEDELDADGYCVEHATEDQIKDDALRELLIDVLSNEIESEDQDESDDS